MSEGGIQIVGASQMNFRPESWKVVIMGPTGPASDGSALGLLYSFTTSEEVEEHAAYFRKMGITYALYRTGKTVLAN